ncbi:MAG TPA: acyl-CoA thioesterase [Puia sp.]|nr:acyl-CoA thioesterase [Puia sp.]
MEKKLQSFYTIRFNDSDPFGHLNNARYIDYFLNAREDHLKEYYQIDLRKFAAQGIGWVVSLHEIQYIRPANYNERVCIQSELLELADSHLLVEMLMLDEAAENLKAILWTKFTCISIKTGKRENHSAEFMDFARAMLTAGRDATGGLRGRVEVLMKKP